MTTNKNTDNKLEILLKRYKKALSDREPWESLWQQCCEYALPQSQRSFSLSTNQSFSKSNNLFDGTAADSVEQLASSMLAELTPPWTRWINFSCGKDLSDEEKAGLTPILEKASKSLSFHFERSNFISEMHQCYLDLVALGTGVMLFEENQIGEISAFKFKAIPLSEVALEEGSSGFLDTVFRRFEISLVNLKAKYPEAFLPLSLQQKLSLDPSAKVNLIESVIPRVLSTGSHGFDYTLFLENAEESVILKEATFERSPFIVFRWLKAAGESYGRSPVMKALPDIKTANKVVELILKNATIAVTGIWQAEDDGVLNPSNIKLTPGTIIPKAVGSKGLTPLEAPGNFDVSELVLTDLRARIRHALLEDKLEQVNTPAMTATEVLERSAQMARILGATYGRLQSELLNPLISKAASILKRRGEIAKIDLSSKIVEIKYLSPIARKQAKLEINSAVELLSALNLLGENSLSIINVDKTIRWLASSLGVPPELLNPKNEQ